LAQGKKQWEVRLPSAPTTLTPIPLPHQSATLVAVALNGGHLHFYHGRQLVDTLRAQQTVSGMVFGRFGQEENALIMFSVGEGLKRSTPQEEHTETHLSGLFFCISPSCGPSAPL